MAWPAVIAAGASVAGGLLTNESAKREARRNREFQERMSSSAHQREVRDLRAAGLNPILSATGGSGASSPAGNMAPIEDVVGKGVTSAIDSLRLKKEIQAADSQIQLNEAQGHAASAAATRDATTAKNNELNAQVLKATLPATLKHAEYDKNMAPMDAILNRVNKATQAIPRLNINLGTSGKKPSWQGVGKDGTKYHLKTGEILNNKP